MNVEMCPLEIVGLKPDLQAVLHTLRRLGCVQIDQLSESTEVSARPLTLDRETLRAQEDLNLLLARIEGLLEILGCSRANPYAPAPAGDLAKARTEVDALLPAVQSLTARREKLQAELASLPRYEATLRKLLPIIPPSARDPGNSSVGVLVSRAFTGVLDLIGKRVLELTGGRAELVASDVDQATRAMLVVFPVEFTGEIESLLRREDVTRLRLPQELGEGPPDTLLSSLQRRMAAIPVELKEVDRELAALSAQWCDRLAGLRSALHEEIDTRSVLSHFGETDQTFVFIGWVPARDFDRVAAALQEEVGPAVFVQRMPLTPELKKRAPVVLHNSPPARPFESLVGLLSLPRYGHIDPSSLMAFFLPLFFGMILGDVGYGGLLLFLSFVAMRRFKAGLVHDILSLLVMGSAWSIVFGFLFGEAFGTLGERLGMHPVLFSRTSPESLLSLLLMAVAVGAVHITLGLILGVWEAARDRSRSHLLERGGMLVGLLGLFLLVGVLADLLPEGFMTPAVSVLIVGIVILSSSLGWLGIFMGPIEFIGLIGNILSYLRIAAIGLASVYLAQFANEIAGLTGSLIVGVMISVLFHALNLVLGGFSPTIHSLRLHYVEFFRKFYEGGGRPYRPFRSLNPPGSRIP
jgi:V/A-type H+-transporting ATPase subunit I